jgi:peroxiredoxin
MAAIKTGVEARDFTLKDHEGNDVSLSGLRGKKVLLSWHPLAWTGVCAKQMQSVDAKYRELEALGTVPLGLSVDTVPSKKAWAKELGLKSLRLLSDFWPHGAAAASLGIFRDGEGISERANIILDEKGKVIFVKVYPLPELPDVNELLAFLREFRG